MEEKLQLRIVSIKQETAEAKTYELEPVTGTVNFLPGQFLTFLFHFEHEELRRSYSIISLPAEPLKVTVQRVENGAVSRYIFIHWHPETLLEALPPAGRFTIEAQKKYPRDIFFFAAGSGIAPIFPLIRYLLKEEQQSAVHLFYSNTFERRILFHKEITELEKKYPQFRVNHFLSNPEHDWQKRQRLNNGILEILIKQNLRYNRATAVFMTCGPFTYMRMVRLTLIYMKFEEDQIRAENFLPEVQRSGTRIAPVFPDRFVQILIKGKVHKILVKSGQTILKAALEAGLKLPYSCEGGICSSCAARCTSGKVKMSINEVLTPGDIREGWILTCTGYPTEENTEIEY